MDLIAVAVSSKGIEWISNELSKVLKSNIPILILTKGLAINNNNYEILAHKVERLIKNTDEPRYHNIIWSFLVLAIWLRVKDYTTPPEINIFDLFEVEK